MDPQPTTPLHVLLPTIGSAGDVHPVVALGMALQSRGHRATVLTNPLFEPLVAAQGLGFLPVGTAEQAMATVADPDLWHPRKGFDVIARRAILPAIVETYRHIERHAGPRTVVAASAISFGARIARETLDVRLATVNLQPGIIRSLVDHGMIGNIRISASQPMWFKKAFFRVTDWLVVDRALAAGVNGFRATLGLPPVSRLMHRWMQSPDLVIGFFPDWFAEVQPDWPAPIHLVGFPLWDSDSTLALTQDARDFLDAGPPPVVITPGSAGATMQSYFEESVSAVASLGARAMLVTNFPDQLPRRLPPSIRAFGYQPFSQLLPHAALLVYPGGVGTLAQTIKAAIPHLVVPHSHDQFDNALRIERLALGRGIPRTRYRAKTVAAAMRELLDDDAMSGRCRQYATRIDSDASLARACALIEALGTGRRQLAATQGLRAKD